MNDESSSGSPKIAMVAGEASGDLLAALLLDGLKTRFTHLQSMGIGGSAMQERGFEIWWHQQKLAVRGYVEVLPHLRELLKIRKQLGDKLLNPQYRPAIFIGVDAPDFNLNLEKRLRLAGISTIHFVSPSFWAWRAKKVNKLKESADHVLCIFPFEPELLAAHGINATFVGHPIANMIPIDYKIAQKNAREKLNLNNSNYVDKINNKNYNDDNDNDNDNDNQIIALLPGSRQSEIKYNAPIFFKAAALLQKAKPNLKFILPTLPIFVPILEKMAKESNLKIEALQILKGQSHEALAACDATLIASGTATLEAALFKRPMVIAYNMPWLSWFLLHRKQLQPWIGLPNILCKDFVVPEFIQQKATPENLCEAMLNWLNHPEKVIQLEEKFTQLHKQLRADTAQISLSVIEKILNKK